MFCIRIIGIFAVLFFGASNTLTTYASTLIWTQTQPSVYEPPIQIGVDTSGIYYVGRTNSAGSAIFQKRDLSSGAVIWTVSETGNGGTGAFALDASGVYAGSYSGSGTIFQKRDLSSGAVIWKITLATDGIMSIAQDATYLYITGYGRAPFQIGWFTEKRRKTDGGVVWSVDSNVSSTYVNGANDIAVDASATYAIGRVTIGTDPQWKIEKRNISTGALLWEQTFNNAVSNSAVEEGREVRVDATGLYVRGDAYNLGTATFDNRIEKRSLTTGAVIWGTTLARSQHYPAGPFLLDATGLYTGGFATAGVLEVIKWNLSTGAITWDATQATGGSYAFVLGLAHDGTNIYLASYDNAPGNYQWRAQKLRSSDGSLIWSRVNNFSAGGDTLYWVNVDASGVYLSGWDNIPGGTTYEWRMEKWALNANCTGPFAASWTDPTLTANSTKIRKVHIDELRSAINTRRVDAGLSNYSWTDPTLTANSTTIRKVHIDELRTAISQVYTTCGQAAPTWTDSTLTANSTKIRKVHIDELRSVTANAL